MKGGGQAGSGRHPKNILRCSLAEINFVDASNKDTSSMRCLCTVLNILLFKLFDDIVDRKRKLRRLH